MEKFTGSEIQYVLDIDSIHLKFLNFDEEIIGKEIKVTLCYGVLVIKEYPKNEYREINSKGFTAAYSNAISFYDVDFEELSYEGKEINVGYFLLITINDKLFFKDTQGFFLLDNKKTYKYQKLSIDQSVYLPIIDRINYKELLQFLPNFVKLIIFFLFLILISWIMILFTDMFNMYLWVVDFKEDMTLLVHKIVMSVVGIAVFLSASFMIGVFLSRVIKYRVNYKYLADFLDNGDIKGLITGEVLFDIKNITIMISIGHYERGRFYEYEEVYDKKNKQYREEKILKVLDEKVGNYVLFNKTFEKMESGESLEYYIKGKIMSQDFFKGVVPSICLTEKKGKIGLISQLEFRVKSPQFKDIIKVFPLNINKERFNKDV